MKKFLLAVITVFTALLVIALPLLIWVISVTIGGFAVMFLWNIIAAYFGIKTITFAIGVVFFTIFKLFI